MSDLIFGLIVLIVIILIAAGIGIGIVKLMVHLTWNWADHESKIIEKKELKKRILDAERKKNRRKEDK